MAMIILAMGTAFIVLSQLEYYSRTWGRSVITTNIMAQAKEALLGYAATYRDRSGNDVFGYLPCPDTAGDGTEAGNCDTAGNAAVGLLPFKSLGLPDLRDSDGVCLWYAVSGRFKAHPQGTAYHAITNPTAQPLNWDTQGQFAIVGTAISPDSGDGGAAAIIFAAGPPLTGQNRNLGGHPPCNIDPTTISDYLDGNYNFGTNATIPIASGIVKDGSGNVTNNDLVAWITPKEIFDRVIKRADFGNGLAATPAGQINKLIDEVRVVLDKRIQDDIFAGGIPTDSSKPDAANTVSTAPYYVGSLQPSKLPGNVDNPDRLTQSNTTMLGAYYGYFDNWADQFRQVTCPNLDTPCLAINTGGVPACRGALLFAGRRADGLPRPATEKAISASCNWKCVLGKYFEGTDASETPVGTGGFALLVSGSGSFSGKSAYTSTNAATRAGDVAACLGYGTFTSLKHNADQFNQGTIRPSGGANAVAFVSGIGTASPVINLGSGTASASAGCVWYPTALPLVSSLRAYFTFRIDSASSSARGFTLALADAATNDPGNISPLMCGTNTAASLGYAGAPVTGLASVAGKGTLAISGASWSASTGRASITTSSNHNFAIGDTVTISGAYPPGYNGSFVISSSGFTTTRFRYTVADPGPASVGIKPPKLGLEFDTFTDSASNDPASEHVALVFWGAAGDNNPAAASVSRDGGDDNRHADGIVGDGSQPLNARISPVASATATPVATIAAAQWDGATITATTSAPHGFALGGKNLIVSDVTALGYKGFQAATVTDNTHFTYPMGIDPGRYPQVATVATATWANGMATVTTSAAHGLATGQTVALAGMTPTAWNTNCTTTVINATQITCPLPANPGTYISGGLISIPLSTIAGAIWSGGIPSTITAATWAAGTATVTTAVAHGLATGQYATLTGASPTAWNGSYLVTVLNATQFTFASAASPGVYISGGSVTSTATVTLTTTTAHGLISDQFVTLSGITPPAYNGTYRVTVIDATHFSHARTSSPGSYVSGGQVAVASAASTVFPAIITTITGVSWSAGQATFTAAGHGLVTGQTAYISGMNPTGYNGIYVITYIDANRFRINLPNNPGALIAGGTFAVATPTASAISGIAWSASNGGTATVATTAPHGLATGQLVDIAGASPAEYNGIHAVNVVDSVRFSYLLANDPGDTYPPTNSLKNIKAGISSIYDAYPYVTNPIDGTQITTLPIASDMHVRLDISRSYDANRRQATVSIKAYLATSPETDTAFCPGSFQNLARDMATLCLSRPPTIEQDGIVINDVAGPALANIFLGFTTARSVSSNDNQDIKVKNLILRSQ